MIDTGNGYHGNGQAATTGLPDQLPPQSLEAERGVLCSLLLDNGHFEAVLGRIEANDFYRAPHQMIFRAMVDLYEGGHPVEIIGLVDELNRRDQFKLIGGLDFLRDIADAVPHAANCVYFAGIVQEKSAARQAIQSSTEVIREGYSGLYTSQQLLDRAASRFANIRSLAGEPWPELTLKQAPDVLPFPTDVFPVALQRYCLGTAQVTLAPPDVVGAAMLAVASAAIGQSVNIYLKRTWHESPLLNMLIVALPGQSKTPPMKLVVKPLTGIDGDLRKASKLEREAWEELKKTAPKGVNPGPEPRQRRAVVKDITRETLVTILADNPRGLLADPDEATGWIGSFNQYKSKGNDRQFWLDIWSSRPTSVDREGGKRSSWVPCPLVTVLGGLPPDMLGTLAEEQGRNDGFFDRLLFSYPGTFPNQEWTEDELDEGDESTWDAVLTTLHKVEMFFDKDKNVCRPYLVNFDPAAKDVWVKWFNPHCKEMEAEDAPAWQAGVWSKLRSYCARFCLILSRIRLATGVDTRGELARGAVTAEDVRGAIKLVDYFKSHVAKVQNRSTGGTGSPDAQAILAWIRRKGLREFSEHDLLNDLRYRFADGKSPRIALDLLCEASAIRPKSMHVSPRKRGRKPSQVWEVNPAVLADPEKDS